MRCTLAPVLLALLWSCSLASCAGPDHREHVREIREFPEYGGWLPVLHDGRVHPDYVLDEGRVPPTRELAERHVAGGTASAFDVVLSAVSMVSWPAFLLAYAHGSRDEPKGSSSTLVVIRVLDEQGRILRDAHAAAFERDLRLHRYVDDTGKRTFVRLPDEMHRRPDAWVDAVARHARVLVVGPEVVFWRLEPHRAEALPPGDASLQPLLRQAEYGDVRHPLYWNEPKPHAIAVAWAPGYEPGWAALPRLRRSRSVEVEVRLRRAPDSDLVRAQTARLLDAAGAVSECVRHRGLGLGDELDHECLQRTRQELRSMVEDASLPGWLRTNAHVALVRHLGLEIRLCELASGAWLSKDAAAGRKVPELERELSEVLDVGRPAWGAVDDSGPDPRELDRGLGAWLNEAQLLGLDRGGEDDPRLAAQEELVERARRLLAEFEAHDPLDPRAEALRAGIALHDGRVEEARRLARYLHHDTYFGMFYGCLRQPRG